MAGRDGRPVPGPGGVDKALHHFHSHLRILQQRQVTDAYPHPLTSSLPVALTLGNICWIIYLVGLLGPFQSSSRSSAKVVNLSPVHLVTTGTAVTWHDAIICHALIKGAQSV